MRAELPWNVAGIAPEAREAARAAARREGLSVGEWLTRRILRDLSDLALMGDGESAAKRRDTEEMLARLKEAEAEATESYRHIEQRLRLVTTDFDTAGRSQSESNRAMSRAANEIHTAGREQAEAFEQLTRHMASLEQRLDQLEQSSARDGLKEAVKGLHQGLSRLASELGQTTARSGVQVASLARNLEQLALRLVAARGEAENVAKLLDARLTLMEEAHHVTADAIDRAVEKWDDEAGQADILAQLDAQGAGRPEVLARIEERIAQVEQQARDALEPRLEETERALSQVLASLERDPTAELADRLANMSARLDSVEKHHDAMLVELSARMADVAASLAAHEHRPEQPVEAFVPESLGDRTAEEQTAEPTAEEVAPWNAEEPVETAPRDDFDQDDAFTGRFEISEDLAKALARPICVEPQPSDAAPPGPSSLEESFLQATIATAPTADLRFRPSRPAEPESGSRRYLAFLAVTFFVLLGAAGWLVLRQRAVHPVAPPTVQHEVAQKPAPSIVPTVAVRASGSIPSPVPSQNASAPAASVAQDAAQPDKLLAAANGGNAAAETILGLGYLDGTASDPILARQWLEKAAAAGQPVAQYRLGTVYERGQGVSANAALAVKWYLAAAQQGNRKAMHNLAVAYAEGTAGPKNMPEAARWFAKAAALGLSDSQFNLAVLYERGDGVPQSLASAYKWYAVAAAQGDVESKARLSVLETQLSPADRAAAMRAAQDFRPLPLDSLANLPPALGDIGG